MRRNKLFIILALFLAPLFIAGCADKKKLDNMEKTQKEILAKVTTIEENQQKILKFFQPRQQPQTDPDKVHNIPEGKSPIKGDKNATVNIVEFSDFECPYCARLQPTLKEVLKAYPKNVKLVYKHFPLSFHKQAKNAAKASMAAHEQGKFWEMHDLIFENYNKLSDEKFKEFSAQLGLDAKKFDSDYKSNKYDNQIQQEISLGQRVGVRGTPTLFLNGKRMQRRDVNDFKEAIDNILKK